METLEDEWVTAPDVYYWIHWSQFREDGIFVVKTSKYSGELHMTGFTEVAPNNPDYSLWQWLVTLRGMGELASNIISNKDLEQFRTIYNASAV